MLLGYPKDECKSERVRESTCLSITARLEAVWAGAILANRRSCHDGKLIAHNYHWAMVASICRIACVIGSKDAPIFTAS